MHLHSLNRAAMALAVLALPVAAVAAPDQNTNPNSNQCAQWNNNGQCVQWNNGRHRDRDDRGDRDDRNQGNHYGWDNGRGNPHGNGNNGYGNGNNGYGNNGYGYGNNGAGRGGQLSGTVSSFSPYNLYLSNGTHVELHDGTVINPTGTNLTGGQRVRVIGNWNGDGSFNANEIDVVGNGYRR